MLQGKNIIYKSSIIADNVHIGDRYIINGQPREIPLQLNTLPFVDNKDVVGRDDDLHEVWKLIQTSEKVVLVNGLGGIGKTTFAKYFVAHFREAYNYIAWVNVTSNIKEAFIRDVALIDSLCLRDEMEVLPKNDAWMDSAFLLMINRMRQLGGDQNIRKNLLIIDNAGEDIEDTRTLDQIALRPNWKVLVTSREKLIGFTEHELGLLTPENAKRLFYHHYQRENNDAMVEKILQLIDYHTLLIEMVSKTAQSLRLDLTEMFDRLKKKGLNISDEAQIKFGHNFNQKVFDIFDYLLTIFEIADTTKYDQWILLQFSILPSVHIPYKEENEIGILKFLQIKDIEKRIEFTSSLNSLVEKGWLHWDSKNDSFKMHNLIQEILRFKLTPTVSKCQQLIDFFRETLRINHKTPIIRQQVFTSFIESIIEKIKESHILLADLANFLDGLYEKFGYYKKSEKYSLLGLKILDDSGIAYLNQNRATFYNNLAETYRHLGDLKKSMVYAKKAVEIRENILDEYHPLLATSYNNLANSYIELGDFENALRIEKRVESIREKMPVNFDSQVDLATTYNNIASIYFDLTKYDLSLYYNEKAISLREKYLPAEHEDLAQSYNNIGILYTEIGNVANAIRFLEKSILISEKIHAKHPELARALCNLGATYFQTGNLQKALELISKGTKLREELLEPLHQDIANSYFLLSALYFNFKDNNKALMYINKSVDICNKIFPKNHPFYVEVMNLKNYILSRTM